ncbi:reverse transcriptase and rnase h [Colletotrichum incanum]|uniref:Reverse transcriptase and rnase h n=1 Tax=Colletotrichum incanum TaxID=1573173 RepID=A0A162Q5T3_COLIC|nr:reverse transcriptase and rnase h [Colletotrichum incanum]
MSTFGWHFDAAEAAQQFFSFAPPPPYFPPFDYYGNQHHSSSTYQYESPPRVFELPDLRPQDNSSSHRLQDKPDCSGETVRDLLASNSLSLCKEDQFIVEARLEKRAWGETRAGYEAAFGASRSSTQQALAMRLSRLKAKYPKIRSILGGKTRKRARSKERTKGVRGSSRLDAVAAAQTLLDFLRQPGKGKLVSQADSMAVARIMQRLCELGGISRQNNK